MSGIQMEVLPGQEGSQRPGEQVWDVQRGPSRWDLVRGSPQPLLWVETVLSLDNQPLTRHRSLGAGLCPWPLPSTSPILAPHP